MFIQIFIIIAFALNKQMNGWAKINKIYSSILVESQISFFYNNYNKNKTLQLRTSLMLPNVKIQPQNQPKNQSENYSDMMPKLHQKFYSAQNQKKSNQQKAESNMEKNEKSQFLQMSQNIYTNALLDEQNVQIKPTWSNEIAHESKTSQLASSLQNMSTSQVYDQFKSFQNNHAQEQDKNPLNIAENLLSKQNQNSLYQQQSTILEVFKFPNNSNELSSENLYFYQKITQIMSKCDIPAEKSQSFSQQQLKQTILKYQNLIEKEYQSFGSQDKKKYVDQLNQDEAKQAVTLLERIIKMNKSRDLKKEVNLIEDMTINWKCDDSDRFQNPQIYNNYQAAVKRFSKQMFIESEQKFKKSYKTYVVQRHFGILNKIKQLKSPILPRYEKIDKGQSTKGITIQMEKGLILPLMYFQSRRNQFKFFSLFSGETKLKFIKQITESLILLNQKDIWHNDVVIRNVVYSVEDNRFKLIDYDSSRQSKNSNTSKQKQVNFSYYQIIQLDYFVCEKEARQINQGEQSPAIKRSFLKFNNYLKKIDQIQDCHKNSTEVEKMIQFMHDQTMLKLQYYAENDQIMLAKLFEELFQSCTLENISLQNGKAHILSVREALIVLKQLICLKLKNFNTRLQNQQKSDNQKSYQNKKTQSQINQYFHKSILNIQNSQQRGNDLNTVQIQTYFKQQEQNSLNNQNAKFFKRLEKLSHNKQRQNHQVSHSSDLQALTQDIFSQEHFSLRLVDQDVEYNSSKIGDIRNDLVEKADFVQEQDNIKQLIKFIEASFGEDSEDHKEEMHKLQNNYYKNGEFENALNYYIAQQEKIRIKIGEDNEEYANILNKIGGTYYSKSDYGKAFQYYFKSLKIRKQNLGQLHPSYAISLSNIGTTYYTKGDHKMALEYYLKSLQIKKKVKGELHPSYATSLYNIGTIYYGQGKYNKALQYYLKSLQIRNKAFGQLHPSCAVSLDSIGAIHLYKGEYHKALQYQFQSLQIREKILGELHPSYATSLNNIGTTYNDIGEYKTALQYHFKSLNIRKKVFGELHLFYAISLDNIGITYYNQGYYDLALQGYFKSLQIRKKVLGEQHPDYVTFLDNIAVTCDRKGDFDMALEYYLLSLQIRSKVLDELHPDYEKSLNKIGSIYDYKGEFGKALQYYLKSLQIRKQVLGQLHPNYVSSLICIGTANYNKGDYGMALQYYLKSVQITKKAVGELHPDYINFLNNVKLASKDIGDYVEAKI